MRAAGGRSGKGDCSTLEQPRALAFSGVHVISPRLIERLTEEGAFSIITSYLRLAGRGKNLGVPRR